MTSNGDSLNDELSALALGALSRSEAEHVRAVAAESPDAVELLATFRAVARTLLHAVPQVEPLASLKARVMAVAGAASPAHTAPARQAAVLPFATRSAAAAWMALAAAVILAVGVTAYAWQLRERVGTLEAQLSDATTRLANAEAEMRDTRVRLVRTRAETAVLSAADLARVDLAGQKGAPNAVARAFWSRSHGLVLTATQLPDLPRGRTYQLWVLTAGAPVSAGLFVPDAEGRAAVVFDTPVSLPAPTGMAVSIEPEGGVPAPTGDIILMGTELAD